MNNRRSVAVVLLMVIALGGFIYLSSDGMFRWTYLANANEYSLIDANGFSNEYIQVKVDKIGETYIMDIRVLDEDVFVLYKGKDMRSSTTEYLTSEMKAEHLSNYTLEVFQLKGKIYKRPLMGMKFSSF